jgi:hypothetical protein
VRRRVFDIFTLRSPSYYQNSLSAAHHLPQLPSYLQDERDDIEDNHQLSEVYRGCWHVALMRAGTMSSITDVAVDGDWMYGSLWT